MGIHKAHRQLWWWKLCQGDSWIVGVAIISIIYTTVARTTHDQWVWPWRVLSMPDIKG